MLQTLFNATKRGDLAAVARAVQDVLFQKQQRALMAYTESLKTTIPIKINRELL